ncbi:Palmitoyltransferase ZDHHC15B [Astathelohania contejeani]|uniref:Palmitoyltransferase n=1 Tax=Astathelohania contejeani TaxID=164912 RepID=A0ABQ7I2Z3_9MICR|nr:Palmitoyltransferase ZDHHC15B [Thelohania contejeani]
MTLKEFKEDFTRFIAFSIYPVITIYGYYVMIGIYTLDSKRFRSMWVLSVFLIYHFILLYILIFYTRIISTDEVSTINLFPHLRREVAYLNLYDINPFIGDEINRKQLKRFKTCDKCRTYKPPRTHHCSICNKCYLKMDHHCALLDCCIGFHNYKAFYIFLFLNCVLNIYNIVVLMIELLGGDSERKFDAYYITCIILYAIELVVFISFFILHTWLIFNNETTIEYQAINDYLQGVNMHRNVFQEGPLTGNTMIRDRKLLNPYNLGYSENWTQVFGTRIIDWFLPTFSSVGDGVSFHKNTVNQEE